MRRRDLIFRAAPWNALAAISEFRLTDLVRGAAPQAHNHAPPVAPLASPASGTIPVAVVLRDGAAMIDFAGPWEVF